MKKKLVLATVVAAIMMFGLVGCGVKITNIAVPDAVTVEKGEAVVLPVAFGTDDAPALPLITTAKIAGSNVNDAGCTPVVRVTYSIIPMFETGDTQTATAGSVSSNR